MIKTLTPYYITTPFTTDGGGGYPSGTICSKYTLEIVIWQGSKLDQPETPNYSITINNPTASDGDSKINIARLVNDFIDFTPETLGSTGLIDSSNQTWVRTQVYYYVGSELIDTPTRISTQLAVKGYGYGMEGENPDTPDNKILMRVGDYTMQEGGKFIVPIELDEVEPDPITPPEIVITSITQITTTLLATLEFTYEGNFAEIYGGNPFYLTIEDVATGDSYIVSVVDYTSPQNITFPYYAEWDVVMNGYNSDSNTTLASNLYNITLTE